MSSTTDLGGNMITVTLTFDPATAKAYILDHDRDVKTWNRLTTAKLRVTYAAKLRAEGITVLIGGPAGMSKDELISALAEENYPQVAEARAVYYESMGWGA
jgi:hypothetical protein